VIPSSAGVLVADIHGSIHLLNRDFESINSWIAHVGGRVTHMVERRGILVTLGVRLFIGRCMTLLLTYS
jgi:vacuolar protein sorting-associated protein 11